MLPEEAPLSRGKDSFILREALLETLDSGALVLAAAAGGSCNKGTTGVFLSLLLLLSLSLILSGVCGTFVRQDMRISCHAGLTLLVYEALSC
jgi:hypothetical protein